MQKRGYFYHILKSSNDKIKQVGYRQMHALCDMVTTGAGAAVLKTHGVLKKVSVANGLLADMFCI